MSSSPSSNLPSGIICSPADYALSSSEDSRNISIHCLPRNESIALSFAIETGFLSLIAVLIVFGLIIRNVLRYRRLSRPPNRPFKWSLIQKPSDVYMLALFMFDLIQALGGIINLKWVIEGKVYLGPVCSAQGAMQQLGETGVALVTTAITVQTFVVWSTGRGMDSVKPALFVVGLITLFVSLFVIIGIATHANKASLYESPTPYWCWIGEKYTKLELAGEYVWLWISLGISFLVYIPLFVWIIRKWRKARRSGEALTGAGKTRVQSLSVLSYPFSYSILVLPLSIVRWIGFIQENKHGKSTVPAGATIAVIVIFGMSGVVNVLLFLLTKPYLLLFSEPSMVNDDQMELGEMGPGANGAAYSNEYRIRDSGVAETRSRGARGAGADVGGAGGEEEVLPVSPVSSWIAFPHRDVEGGAS